MPTLPPMFSRIPSIGCPLSAVLATLLSAGGAVPSHASEPARAVLLLDNGDTLCGTITQEGDRYLVAVAGGRISVDSRQVRAVGRDLREIYAWKRTRIRPDDARDRADLAAWCQRQGLSDLADGELAAARALDPDEPTIALVERRLEAHPPEPQADLPEVRPVRLAAPRDELEKLVREMPPGTVEAFAQTIQPMLVNHCTVAGCHGPSSGRKFELMRLPAGRPPSRMVTQRNLKAVLDWIDTGDPAASRLLTEPLGPHGADKTAIFDRHTADQYRQIFNWVHWAAGRPQPVAAATAEAPSDEPTAEPAVFLAPAAGEPELLPAGPADVPSNETSASDTAGPSVVAGQRGEELPEADFAPAPKVQRGAQIPAFVPADPFDPAIFNRRFFGQGESPDGRPQP